MVVGKIEMVDVMKRTSEKMVESDGEENEGRNG